MGRFNLDAWLEKHSYRIEENRETSISGYYDEEEEGETGGILSSNDVMEASYEGMISHLKKEKIDDFLSDEGIDISKLTEEQQRDLRELLAGREGRDLDNVFTPDELDELEEKGIEIPSDIKEKYEDWLSERITPDDYYPIWLTAWEFPTGYSAEQLNLNGISGLVFFEIRDRNYGGSTTFVSLTACGMDMSPSIEYAYFTYSNLEIPKTLIRERILHQPSYYSSVVGMEDFKKLCNAVGLTQRKLDYAEKRVGERMNAFTKSLDDLSALRDSGKLSQNEAGLLGLMQYFKHNEKEKEEVKEIAK